jgi:hypothetical protein
MPNSALAEFGWGEGKRVCRPLRAFPILFSNSQASSPVLFGRRRVRPLPSSLSAALERSRGRAGRCRVRAHSSLRRVRKRKVLGPAGLDASRHRGLSNPARLLAETRPPQVRQSLGVPRAVFIGLLRIAPGGLTVSGDPASLLDWKAAYPPLIEPKWCPALPTVPAANVGGARVARGQRAGTKCGLDRRIRENCAASPTPPNRPPLPAPHLETADPSVTRAGWMRI